MIPPTLVGGPSIKIKDQGVGMDEQTLLGLFSPNIKTIKKEDVIIIKKLLENNLPTNSLETKHSRSQFAPIIIGTPSNLNPKESP